MVFASWADYQASSLRDRMQVSRQLAQALGLPSRSGMADEFMVADRLALELGLPEDNESESVYRFLVCLVPSLEQLLASGKLQPSDGARDVARSAVAGLEVSRAIALAEELGWDRFDQSRPAQRIITVEDIEGALHDLLAQRLERHVFDMVNRWQRNGMWANRPQIVRDLNNGEA